MISPVVRLNVQNFVHFIVIHGRALKNFSLFDITDWDLNAPLRVIALFTLKAFRENNSSYQDARKP